MMAQTINQPMIIPTYGKLEADNGSLYAHENLDVADGRLNNSDYHDEKTRLNTFALHSWPYQDIISPTKLAKAGFYYLGNGDEVVCFSCDGKVKDWQHGDVAVRKHMQLLPGCDFIAEIFNKASKRNLPNGFVQPQLVSHHSQNASHDLNSQGCNLTSPTSIASSNGLCNGQNSRNAEQTSANSEHSNKQLESATNNGSNFELMKSEKERLRTFSAGWPLESPKPSDLAQHGFFYLQERDRVQCAFCYGIVSHWEPQDHPFVEHAKHFPFCSFVMGKNVGNIPIKSNGQDECGPMNKWRFSGPENGRRQQLNAAKPTKLENFGVKLHHGPRHPAQASKDARLRSFVAWPTTSPVKPKDLVEAGFFYIGIKDYTRCFYCDGGLCNWEEGDDPWKEHARWFSGCSYVRLNKGDAYVEACAQQNSSSTQKCASEVHATQPVNKAPSTTTHSSPADISRKVDELMQSPLVQSTLEPGIFPANRIRAALIRRLETGGPDFTSEDELCEAILEMENNSSQCNGYAEQEVEPMEEEEEIKEKSMNIDVRNATVSPTLHSLPVCSSKSPIEDTLKEQQLCKICMDKEIGVLFLPCGHLMSCVQCAPAMSDCPFCRQPIKGTVRAFLT